MEMNRWQLVEQIYHSALEQEESQRAAFLERMCAGNPELRLEVESLLTYVKQTGKLMDKGALAVVAGALAADGRAGQDSPAQDRMLGRTISQYRITGKVGSGGMGDVYRAVRADDAYERHVALKLISAGRQSAFFIKRFKTERQILASLDHPNVGRLFDGGTTEDGIPYLVMEYIEGQPISVYCDERRLSIADRLKLFVQVCSAVQYAHQHLIIHRDIKPDNVLVTSGGVAKLMDFGIAKILAPDAESGQGEVTVTGMRAFTPAYASPEQIKGETISTASDVYSLGVVLYEILTGRSPYRPSSHAQHEVARAICEVEPEKPSTTFASSAAAADRTSTESFSACRNSTPEKLRRTLVGDLDQILLKALRKEPQHRYASAQALADDLQAYALGLPVSARRGTFSYRTAKFIRRNKVSLTVTAVIVLITLAGVLAIVREARIARMEQARAEQRFEALRKLTNSMLFEFHDSIEKLPGSTAVRELIVRRSLEYLEQIAADANNDPATLRDLAAAYERIARVRALEGSPHLGGTGSFQQARELYEKALTIREKLVAANPNDVDLQMSLFVTMSNTASIYYQLGDLDHALALQQRRLEMEQKLQITHDSENLRYRIGASYIGIGDLEERLGEYDSAANHLQQALTLNQSLLKKNPTNLRYFEQVWRCHAYLAVVLRAENKYAEAAAESRTGLSVSEELTSRDPNNSSYQRWLINDNSGLCEDLAYSGSFSEVRGLCQKAIEINEAMVKSDPKNVQARADLANLNMTMGIALYVMHSLPDALRLERRADAMYCDVELQDPDDEGNRVDHATALIYIGRIEARLHQPESARRELDEAEKMLEKSVAASPKYKYYSDTLEEAQAALTALPNDTAPLVSH
jgi:eukaryotic-like serine/threonine-protein kinase